MKKSGVMDNTINCPVCGYTNQEKINLCYNCWNDIQTYPQGNNLIDFRKYNRNLDGYPEPKNAMDYFIRGIVFARRGKKKRAYADFSKAIEFDSKIFYYYNARARILFKQKLYEEALVDFKTAIDLSNDTATLYYNIALVYYEMCDYDECIASVTKRIEIDNGNAMSYFVRGNAYGIIGRYDMALEDLSKSILLNPDYSKAYYLTGLIHYLKNESGVSQNYYKKALDMDNAYYFGDYNDLSGRYTEASRYQARMKKIRDIEDIAEKINAILEAQAPGTDFSIEDISFQSIGFESKVKIVLKGINTPYRPSLAESIKSGISKYASKDNVSIYFAE